MLLCRLGWVISTSTGMSSTSNKSGSVLAKKFSSRSFVTNLESKYSQLARSWHKSYLILAFSDTQSVSVNYAFVDFGNPAKAAFALQTYNGALIPNHQQKRFKLNWASGGGLFDRRYLCRSRCRSVPKLTDRLLCREDKQPEYSIFVGDLSPDWTDSMLLVS